MKKILTLFTKPRCVYCHMLKANLDQWGFAYEEIDVSDKCLKSDIFYIEGHKTVPQLYYNTQNLKNGMNTSDITFDYLFEQLSDSDAYDNWHEGNID